MQQAIGVLNCSYKEFIGWTVIVLFNFSSSNRVAAISVAYFASFNS